MSPKSSKPSESSKKEQELLQLYISQTNTWARAIASAGNGLRSIGNVLSFISNSILSRTDAIQVKLSLLKLQEMQQKEEDGREEGIEKKPIIKECEMKQLQCAVEQLQQQFQDLQGQLEEIKKKL